MPNSSDIQCLELGCGTAPASIALALNYKYITALDYKRNGLGLKLGKKRGEEHCVDINYVQGNGYSLPFKTNTFDFVYCAQVLEHVEHKEDFIKELHRILKLEGIAYLAVPNRLWYKEGHSGLLLANLLPHSYCEWYVKLRKRREKNAAWDVWLPTYFSIKTILTNSSFKILADTTNFIADTTDFTNTKFIKQIVKIPVVKYFLPMLFIIQK